MARTIQLIQSEMDLTQATQSALIPLNSHSQTAIYTLWKYITSSAIWIHETLWDLFKIELELIISNAPVGTMKWVQAMVFYFQYDATNPQIIQLVNFVPSYAPVDNTLNIITRCSVKTMPNRVVNVKVAKQDPPTALVALELSSLAGYLNEISFAGVQYNVTSGLPDELFLNAEIFYDGQYAAVITTNVIAGINNYLAEIPFDGYIRVMSLEDAIQAVPGVIDVEITDLALRAHSTAFGSKTYLVHSKTTIFNKYPTSAGYLIGETTGGEDFLSQLTFTPE